MNYIVDLFDTIVPLPQSAADLISTSFQKKTVLRRRTLKPMNRDCKEIYFVEQGLLRVFYGEGRPCRTSHFVIDNELCILPQPFSQGVEALEPSTLHVVSVENIENILRLFPPFYNVLHHYQTRLLQCMDQWVLDWKMFSAAQRYEQFLADFPDHHALIDDQHIAEYIDVHPAWLSKIKRDCRKQQAKAG